MSEKIGERFQAETAIECLGASAQKRGVPVPPLEVRLVEGAEVALSGPAGAWDAATLTEAIRLRRSLREYSEAPLSLSEFSFLLWATQGVDRVMRDVATFRTVPSAGARHAFETLLVVQRVEGLAPGLYQYMSHGHRLLAATATADAQEVAAACLGQAMIASAAVTFAWVAVRERMTWRYGERGYRYMYLDAGHVCQNLYLACEAIGAGACAIGAYDDAATNALFGLDGRERFVIYLASVGKKIARS